MEGGGCGDEGEGGGDEWVRRVFAVYVTDSCAVRGLRFRLVGWAC